MTETDTQQAPKQKKQSKSKSPIWRAVLLVIVVILLAGGIGYLGLTQHQMSRSLDGLQQENYSLEQQLSEIRQNQSRASERLNNKIEKLTALTTTLDKQALFNAKQLNALHKGTRTDWLLAEAEYLMRLANQRLAIEQDKAGAEAILQAADRVLSEIDDPGLLPARTALSQEILALQSVEGIDRQGLYARIDAIIGAIDELEQASFLNRKTQLDSASSGQDRVSEMESNWQTRLKALLNELDDAFVIRRLDAPVQPLMAPDQSYYLKQNLRLMLEKASLALLDGNASAFESSLENANAWLDTYFVQEHAKVQAIQASIRALSGVRIDPELPDISESLRLLKNRIEAMYRQHQLDRQTSKEEVMQEEAE